MDVGCTRNAIAPWLALYFDVVNFIIFFCQDIFYLDCQDFVGTSWIILFIKVAIGILNYFWSESRVKLNGKHIESCCIDCRNV